MGMNRNFAKEDRGSLSILMMSLFIIIIITVAIMSDISSIYLAKRSLTQATEAAAQRGSRNLDLKSYYRGEYNFTKFLIGLTGNGETDPGIPIDCEQGERDAVSTLRDWSNESPSVMRSNMSPIVLLASRCDGFEIELQTSSEVSLPFVLPFIGIEKVKILASVGSIDERKTTSQ